MRVASRNVRSEAISRRTHKEQEVKDTVSTIQLNCSLTLLGLYIEYSGRGVIAFFFLRNKIPAKTNVSSRALSCKQKNALQRTQEKNLFCKGYYAEFLLESASPTWKP